MLGTAEQEDRWAAPAPRRKGPIYSVAIGGVVAIVAVVLLLTLRNGSNDSNRLDVWIQAGAPTARVRAIEQATESIRGVSKCQFWSQQRDYREALRLLGNSRVGFLGPRSIPSSYRCQIPDGSGAAGAVDRLRGMADVFQVTDVPSQHVPATG